MKLFVVYRVNPILWGRSLRKIGEVQAPNAPKALLVAFATWPDQLDPKQVQSGLVVREKH